VAKKCGIKSRARSSVRPRQKQQLRVDLDCQVNYSSATATRRLRRTRSSGEMDSNENHPRQLISIGTNYQSLGSAEASRRGWDCVSAKITAID